MGNSLSLGSDSADLIDFEAGLVSDNIDDWLEKTKAEINRLRRSWEIDGDTWIDLHGKASKTWIKAHGKNNDEWFRRHSERMDDEFNQFSSSIGSMGIFGSMRKTMWPSTSWAPPQVNINVDNSIRMGDVHVTHNHHHYYQSPPAVEAVHTILENPVWNTGRSTTRTGWSEDITDAEYTDVTPKKRIKLPWNR